MAFKDHLYNDLVSNSYFVYLFNRLRKNKMNYIEDPKKVAEVINLLRKEIGDDFRIQCDTRSSNFSINFWLRAGNRDIAHFELVQQTNCCGILVSTNTIVYEGYRGQGLAQNMMPLKEALAKEFGFSLLLATVNMTGNPVEVHILEKFGWKLKDSFVNSRTKNTVGIFTKEIK